MDAEKIRKEFGYKGKPKQWQVGFDALLKHMPDYQKEANKDKSALNDGLERFYFDRYNPLGNAQMAEGANVVAADEREALVKAREMFGLEWVFKLRKREAC